MKKGTYLIQLRRIHAEAPNGSCALCLRVDDQYLSPCTPVRVECYVPRVSQPHL